MDDNQNKYPYGYGYSEPPPQPSQQQYTYQPQPKSTEPSQGFAIASLVLSLISVVGCCIPFPLAILGLIFALVAKSHGNRSGIATAGLVISIVVLALAIVSVVIGLLFSIGPLTALTELQRNSNFYRYY